jgi:hypothetical protein
VSCSVLPASWLTKAWPMSLKIARS